MNDLSRPSQDRPHPMNESVNISHPHTSHSTHPSFWTNVNIDISHHVLLYKKRMIRILLCTSCVSRSNFFVFFCFFVFLFCVPPRERFMDNLDRRNAANQMRRGRVSKVASPAGSNTTSPRGKSERGAGYRYGRVFFFLYELTCVVQL